MDDTPLLVVGLIILGGILFVACYYISIKILKQIFIKEKRVTKKKNRNKLIAFDIFERPDSRTKIIAYSASGIFALIGIAIFLQTPEDLRSPFSCLITLSGFLLCFIFFLKYLEKNDDKNRKSEWVTQKPVVDPTQWEGPVISERLKSELTTLSEKPTWNWDRFRSILICQGRIGEGCYIPAAHRPDYIYLDGFLPTINELRQISSQRNGRETSRVGLVDRERQKLVISGKTVVGTDSQVHLYLGSEPGRGSFSNTNSYHPCPSGQRRGKRFIQSGLCVFPDRPAPGDDDNLFPRGDHVYDEDILHPQNHLFGISDEMGVWCPRRNDDTKIKIEFTRGVTCVQ